MKWGNSPFGLWNGKLYLFFSQILYLRQIFRKLSALLFYIAQVCSSPSRSSSSRRRFHTERRSLSRPAQKNLNWLPVLMPQAQSVFNVLYSPPHRSFYASLSPGNTPPLLFFLSHRDTWHDQSTAVLGDIAIHEFSPIFRSRNRSAFFTFLVTLFLKLFCDILIRKTRFSSILACTSMLHVDYICNWLIIHISSHINVGQYFYD